MVLETFLEVRCEVLFALCVSFVLFVILSVWSKDRKRYPPGPVGLPIVGYLPFLTRNVPLKFMELSKKYGEVFSLRLGALDVVVLNGSSAVREAFSKPEFLGRPPDNAFSFLGFASPFFDCNMKIWEEQSKFVLGTLKDLGLGKLKIESQILEEIDHFTSVLESHRGKPMDLRSCLMPSTLNNICSLTIGSRIEYGSSDSVILDRALEDGAGSVSQAAAHIFFPWLRHVPILNKVFSIEEAMKHYEAVLAFTNRKIEEHKENPNSDEVKDFIELYLLEMQSRVGKNPHTTFTEPTLSGTLDDILGAGTITVTSALSWCFYVVGALEKVQRRIRKEMAEVLGAERKPEYLDQRRMPYTHAVIMEVMRWKTTVPLNILRYTLENTTVGGYNITKGTTVMVNFYGIHNDPKYWTDPDVFKPERFLSADEKSILKPPSYMPFSLGRRACPGETMANMELFLYLVSVLQKFTIVFPDGEKPTYDGELTIVYRPKPYNIRFIPRT